MNYVISQNVPMCPKCSALMSKFHGDHLYFRCNDCGSRFQVIDIGQAEIELVISEDGNNGEVQLLQG